MMNFQRSFESHENECPHCELVEAAVEEIIEVMETYNPNSPVFYEKLREVIDFVYESTVESTVTTIGLGLLSVTHDVEFFEE